MDCSHPRLLCPWDSQGKHTGVVCHAFLQGIFLTQESNPHLLCLLLWQVGFFTTGATWEALLVVCVLYIISSWIWFSGWMLTGTVFQSLLQIVFGPIVSLVAQLVKNLLEDS